MGRLVDFFSSNGITLPLEPKRQMLELDKEFSALEVKLRALETTNLKLQAEVNPLKEKVKRLEQRLGEQTTKKEKEDIAQIKLDGNENEIIRMLMLVKDKECTTQNIARALKTGTVRAEVYLNRLAQLGLIGQILNMGNGPSYWILQMKGKQYAVAHELDRS